MHVKDRESTITNIPRTRKLAHKNLSDAEKWQVLKGEVEGRITDLITQLAAESEILQSNMEAMRSRLRWRGSDADLTDIKTGGIHRINTTLSAFKEVGRLIAYLEGKEAPDRIMPLPPLEDEEDIP